MCHNFLNTYRQKFIQKPLESWQFELSNGLWMHFRRLILRKLWHIYIWYIGVLFSNGSFHPIIVHPIIKIWGSWIAPRVHLSLGGCVTILFQRAALQFSRIFCFNIFSWKSDFSQAKWLLECELKSTITHFIFIVGNPEKIRWIVLKELILTFFLRISDDKNKVSYGRFKFIL